MAYGQKEIFTRYERFSARIPILPQIFIAAALAYASIRAGIATLDAYLGVVMASGSMNMITDFDIGGVFREPFLSAAAELAGYLAVIVVAAFLMRNLPIVREAGRPAANGKLGKAYEAGAAVAFGIILFGHGLFFVLWAAYFGFTAVIPALFGTLVNYIVVPIATLIVAAAYAYAIASIGRTIFPSSD